MRRLLLFVSGALLYLALLALNQWCLEPGSAESAQSALQRWRTLPGANVPHPLGSAAHAQLGEALERHFQALPLERAHQKTAAGLTNFALRRAGTSALPPVVLMAHWDSVAAGPGAADDGAGMSVLLELAERCAKNEAAPLRSTIFLATDGEERGLLGARAFLEEHPWARDGGVLINLEARGTSGPVFLFETVGNQRALIATAQPALPFPAAFSLAAEIYERMPNDTDLSVFRADPRWHGCNLAFIRGLEHYHTAQDNAENLSGASVAHMLESAEGLLEAWQREAHTPQGREPAPHTSLWGRVLLWWPARANLPLALTLCVFAVLMLRSAWRAWLGGWLALACAALLGWLCQRMGLESGVVIAALGLVASLAALEARAAVALLAQLTLLSALWLPAALPQAALPLLAALLGEALRRILGRESGLWWLLPLAVVGMAANAPFLLALEWVQGSASGVAQAVIAGLVGLPWAYFTHTTLHTPAKPPSTASPRAEHLSGP